MGLRDSLNRLDQRMGADRVGRGGRLTGLAVWPIFALFGIVVGSLFAGSGRWGAAAAFYCFAGAAVVLTILAARAQRGQR